MQRGDVDRHARAHPALGFGKDAAEDIFAQIEDQPAFLAQRNEDRGRDGALFGVVPAHQRFHRADMAAPVHLRLVHHIQPAGGQRMAQIGLQTAAHAQRGVHVRLEEGDTVAPAFLRSIERQIGLTDRLGRFDLGIGDQRDADRHAHLHRAGFQHEGFLEQLEHAARQMRGARRIGFGLEDDKFVTTQPRHGIGRAAQRGHAVGHLADQLVAGMVAQQVVHFLEAVEIEAMHCRLAIIAPRHRQHLAQPVEHHRAVGQAGQRVVEGQMAGTRLAGDQVAGHGAALADEIEHRKTENRGKEGQNGGQAMAQIGCRIDRYPCQTGQHGALRIA